MTPPSQPNSSSLRRPSYFQGPEGRVAMATVQARIRKGDTVSQPVMEALLAQKQQGKLSNSALEHWVNKFEDEYEVYYKDSSEEKQEDLSDIEAQFEALHKQVEEEYATRKFNSSVPQHTLLDSTIAKQKVKLSHKKSFSSKVSKNVNDKTSTEAKQVDDYPAGKNPFEEEDSGCGSPRIGVRTQSSNIARDIKHPKPTHQTVAESFILGTEPIVTNTGGCDKNITEKIQSQQDFFPVTHLTEKEKKILIEKEKNRNRIDTKNQTSDQNDYEDVNVFKKRTKKKKKKSDPVQLLVEAKANDIENIQKTNKMEDNKKGQTESVIKADDILPTISKKELDKKEVSTSQGVDQKGDNPKEDSNTTLEKEQQKPKLKGPKKPFESFQNCLFATFTACVPWCMMKQVYWKKDRKSEELFTITARRNSRTRVKMKFRDQNN